MIKVTPRVKINSGRLLIKFDEFYEMASKHPNELTQDEFSQLKSPLKNLRNQFLDSNLSKMFCETAMDYGRKLEEDGKTNLASIIFSMVIKVLRDNPERTKTESNILHEAITKSIEIYEKNGDLSHRLGRLTELENYFNKTADNKNKYPILQAKLKCLREILKNPNQAKKKYNAREENFPEVNSFKIQLARTFEVISKMLNVDSVLGTNYIKKAIKVYEELKLKNKVLYLKQRLDTRHTIKTNFRKSAHTQRATTKPSSALYSHKKPIDPKRLIFLNQNDSI